MNEATTRHESIHILQQAEMYVIFFYLVYLWDYIVGYIKLGNLSDALIFLQQAMALSPDHEIAAHLGEVLWHMERKSDAIAVWKQGLHLTPKAVF